MRLIITSLLQKNIKKLGYTEESLTKDLSKYKRREDFIILGKIGGVDIGKGYVDLNKKRMIFLFEIDDYIVPIKILKKESKNGWNINKQTFYKTFGNDIEKIFDEIQTKKIYKIINL